jgi:hypothetical protein
MKHRKSGKLSKSYGTLKDVLDSAQDSTKCMVMETVRMIDLRAGDHFLNALNFQTRAAF